MGSRHLTRHAAWLKGRQLPRQGVQMVGARPNGNPKAWDPTESTDEEEEDWDEVMELPVPQAQMKSSFLPQSGGS